jgi:hypothetical protein
MKTDASLPPASSDSPSARGGLRRNGVLIAAVAFLVAPFLVAIAWRLGRTGDAQYPVLDPALVELAVRDVGHAAVLVGPYSRFGFHHPGPLYFYLLAVPYRLLGSNYAALSVGAVLIGATSAVAIVALAVRRGGRALGCMTAVLVLAFVAAAGPIAFDAWTPWVTILPFALSIMLAWSFACGDRWALPLLAGVATFLAQTHIAYVVPVTAISLAAIAIVAFDARAVRRDPDRWPALRRGLLRAGGLAAVVLAVLWLPPLLDQLTHDPGNAHQIASFLHNARPDRTLGDGLEQTARYLGVLPAHLTGDTLSSAGTRGPLAWPTVLTLVAFAGAAVLAIRRRARDELVLFGLTALAILTAVVSVTRIVGPLFHYLVHWIAAIGIIAWVAVAASSLEAWRARVHPPKPWVRVVAAASIVVLAGLLAGDAIGAAREVDRDSDRPAVATMADGVEARLADGNAPIALRVHEPAFTQWPWVAGVLLELRRRGHDVHVVRGGAQSEALFSTRDLVEPGATPTVITFGGVVPGQPADVTVDGITLDVESHRHARP